MSLVNGFREKSSTLSNSRKSMIFVTNQNSDKIWVIWIFKIKKQTVLKTVLGHWTKQEQLIKIIDLDSDHPTVFIFFCLQKILIDHFDDAWKLSSLFVSIQKICSCFFLFEIMIIFFLEQKKSLKEKEQIQFISFF